MPQNGTVNLLVHTEYVPGDGSAGLGVEQLQRLLLQFVQLDAVVPAQGQLCLHVQLLGAVVKQGAHPGLLHVRAVPLRQADGLLLRAQHMGDALVLEVAQGHGPQLGKGQVLQIRPGAVEALS